MPVVVDGFNSADSATRKCLTVSSFHGKAWMEVLSLLLLAQTRRKELLLGGVCFTQQSDHFKCRFLTFEMIAGILCCTIVIVAVDLTLSQRSEPSLSACLLSGDLSW